ncbi:AraC-like DNA-binding protein [Pedobacter sp. AK013]|uniref:helix-turn-helix domain-containing protein n=1 Tax=Pedobacter sp. AK013 TaxID=2723071 RepID=UPI0017D2EA03|nr:helix-turn-helix domain-containing protein [Pedobacter sp. AK013]MBB6236870.1 AraC-like DNA-binding protein [Pedobacter sp. AK013]
MPPIKMHHQEFEATEELQDTIKCFWYNKREAGTEPSAFEVVPDGYAEIIFHFGSGCSIFSDGVLQPLPSPFMMGLLNQPAIFYAKNRLEIIGVRCFPWTVFDLLGLPSNKHGLHLFEHPMAQLQPKLNAFILDGKIDEAVAEVKQYFLQARTQVAANSMLYKAGIAMQVAKGTIPVSEVAAAAHVTVRTLERNFKRSSGHTVKDVSGLMRFEQVRNRLWMDPSANLASLADEFGYTDQPHLSREFKRYSGTSPAAFARKAKIGKQALSNGLINLSS